jgi:hypothetical protein
MSVITRAAPKSPPTMIEVVVWPLRDRPPLAATTLGVLAIVALVVRWATASALLAILATAATAICAWQVFIPRRYEFSAGGITCHRGRTKRRIAWGAIGRWEPRGDGIYLLPPTATAPIDALDGLFIPLGDRRDEVLALVERHTTRAAPIDTSSRRSTEPPTSTARLAVPDEKGPA